MVASATPIHDTTVYLRDLLLNNVTDPSSAGRPSDSKFCMTSFPQRTVHYPLITIEQINFRDVQLGISSQQSRIEIGIEINIWSKSTKQRDQLADSVYNVIRTNQLSGTSALSEGLFDMKITNIFNLDEEGKEGIHRKVIELKYTFLT